MIERPTPNAELTERLRNHALLGSAPTEELEWLATRGQFQRYEKGDPISLTGQMVESLFVILEGHLEIHIERAHGRRKVMEWWTGEVTGVLPYSRMGATPGDVRAVEPTEVLTLPRELVPEMPAACPKVTEELVHVMIDRARAFTSADLHDKKALALGKVAAGLAHELNNPASALIRSAKTLVDTLAARRPVSSLAGAPLPDPAVLEAVDALFAACRGRPPADWDAVERADREQAIEEWLEDAGEDSEMAGVLADLPLTLDELFGLPGVDQGPAIVAAVCAMARSLLAEQLAAEIEDGAARVFHLVDAVKRFTHMDQAMDMAAVDVNAGLRDAATLIAEKARGSGVAVTLDLAAELPTATGVVEELNQLWHSLIDNAVDAAAPDGTVTVASAAGEGWVRVEVRDDGPGIPDEIQDRIFDPFFTTKAVGAGAGLGLELVRRVLEQHRGQVDVESEPGKTVFRASLPAGPGG